MLPHQAQALSVATKITNTDPAYWISNSKVVGDKIFYPTQNYAGPSPNDNAVWRSDGSASGTFSLPGVTSHGVFTGLNGVAYFTGNDGTHGDELWRSDGSPAGTYMVADINPGAGSSDPVRMQEMNGEIYFAANDSDPTVRHRQLWKTDGTAAGTVKLFDGLTVENGTVSTITVRNNVGYFMVDDWTTVGHQIWKTDGTISGTVLVKTIAAGPAARGLNSPRHFSATDSFVFFAADDGVHGQELWKTDGTEAGTVMVADDPDRNTHGTNITYLVGLGHYVYFMTSHFEELWSSDGTAAGTGMLRAFSSVGSFFPESSIGDSLIFPADDGVHGMQLWKSNGTAGGTEMITNIAAGSAGFPTSTQYASQGNKLYFAADDGAHGWEPWVTDGTASGTRLAVDVLPGEASSYPAMLGATDDTVFFQARDENGSNQLWKITGTVLAPPSDLVAATPASSPHLQWLAVDGAQEYRIYRDGNILATSQLPLFTDIGAGEGSREYYVTAIADEVESAPSNTVVVLVDKTGPALEQVSWTTNPVSLSAGGGDLSVNATDSLSGLAGGEYFIGSDPGLGLGSPLTGTGGVLSAHVGGLGVGVHDIGVRAVDNAGNWSSVVRTMLVVYDPSGATGATGKNKKDLVPSLSRGDNLPGLTMDGQPDKADYGFTVGYKNGAIDPKSDLHFAYDASGHSFSVDATSFAWLVIDQANDSRARYQGVATVRVDGVATSHPFSVEAMDGEKMTPSGPDFLVLRVYPAGAVPGETAPLYQASGTPVNNSGNGVKIR